MQSVIGFVQGRGAVSPHRWVYVRLPASLLACYHFRDGLRGGSGFVVPRSLVLCELVVMDVYAPRAGYGEPFGLQTAVQIPESLGEREALVQPTRLPEGVGVEHKAEGAQAGDGFPGSLVPARPPGGEFLQLFLETLIVLFDLLGPGSRALWGRRSFAGICRFINRLEGDGLEWRG